MNPILHYLRTTMNPDWYHGRDGKRPFFEGWYYKIIDPTTQHKYAIIPGVFLSDDPHAFIQVLDGTAVTAHYHRFPLDAFSAAKDRFEVHVGANRFAADGVSLNLNRPEQQLHGELRFLHPTPWPVTLTSPGIMGWYAWVPTMECYHGVVSLDHRIHGALTIDGERADFGNGRGYIEKDWGKSFPSAWIWMQTNHFETVGTSLTASIAMIPWQFTRFRGFIVGFWHEGVLYRFATYTGAVVESLTVDDEQVDWVLRGKTAGAEYRLHIVARRSDAGVLAGPSTVDMGKRVAESLTAEVAVTLERVGVGPDVVFVGNGRFAGLELFNVAGELLKG